MDNMAYREARPVGAVLPLTRSWHPFMTNSDEPHHSLPHATNADAQVVSGFGEEWSHFNQENISAAELDELFNRYFFRFPWNSLKPESVGFDLGCGSGRWAARVARRVGALHCIDASPVALEVARKNLLGLQNCRFHCASVDDIPLDDSSMDFGYSLGVLHHVPDTAAGLLNCVRKLKPGSPFLLYLYYSLEGRPWWYRFLWRISDVIRGLVSRSPLGVRLGTAYFLSGAIYWPLARAARFFERRGVCVDDWPLAFYRETGFATMATDAFDRFGTRLEKRFSRTEVLVMMEAAGLENIEFMDTMPRWIAIGRRKR